MARGPQPFIHERDLQQLLWHISVVEALLGEKKEGLTDLLSRRVACIIGKTQEERSAIHDTFKKLYDFRSDLVHGNSELLKERKIYVGHLREARHDAREALLWFVRCLDHIEARFIESPCNHGLPRREDILASLDMNPGRRHEDILGLRDMKPSRRSRTQWIMKELPAEFPDFPSWDS